MRVNKKRKREKIKERKKKKKNLQKKEILSVHLKSLKEVSAEGKERMRVCVEEISISKERKEKRGKRK